MRAVVVRVGANAGERTLAYAFAGDLAVRLAALLGASGVAPAIAAALVASLADPPGRVSTASASRAH